MNLTESLPAILTHGWRIEAIKDEEGCTLALVHTTRRGTIFAEGGDVKDALPILAARWYAYYEAAQDGELVETEWAPGAYSVAVKGLPVTQNWFEYRPHMRQVARKIMLGRLAVWATLPQPPAEAKNLDPMWYGVETR